MTRKSTEKRGPAVGTLTMRGTELPVYLSSDCQFFTFVTGKRYGAASLKQLQGIVGKITDDTTFGPDRLRLDALDTARREIKGRYKDHLRNAYVSISYLDEKDLYEVDVSVHSQTGRNFSKDFEAGSEALGEQIMAEVARRLSGEEWRREKAREPKLRVSSPRRARVPAVQYWLNPRQKTRKQSSELLQTARDYLISTYDLLPANGSEDEVDFGTYKTILVAKNGQRFSLQLEEEL